LEKKKITVLGAGMVGICCAIELQQRGYQVDLIDRKGPGEETSSGNAGVLSLSSIAPLASPALLPRLPRLAANLDADFQLHYPQLPQLLPWLLGFLKRCSRETYITDGLLINALTLPSVAAHMKLIELSKAQSLVNASGGLRLYRKHKTFMRDELERQLFDLCDLNYSVLEGSDVQSLEPDVADIFVKAVLIEDSVSIRNPESLCKAYAEYFQQLGGELIQDEIKGLSYASEQWHVSTVRGQKTVDRLVVCLGAWTPALLKDLGYRNPIAIERGYHTVFSAQPGKQLSRPIFDVDSSYVMIPMDMGLRVTTGSNLVHHETEDTPRQIEKVTPRAREAFPVGPPMLDKPWMGRRPSTTDSLPIIGPAPRHRGLWLAFAHAHMGFTMGPITGKIIANCVTGEAQSMSIKAYSPSRYL
jgi:D-amino-acid dehydrogenase